MYWGRVCRPSSTRGLLYGFTSISCGPVSMRKSARHSQHPPPPAESTQLFLVRCFFSPVCTVWREGEKPQRKWSLEQRPVLSGVDNMRAYLLSRRPYNWFHLCSVLSGCILAATGGAHPALLVRRYRAVLVLYSELLSQKAQNRPKNGGFATAADLEQVCMARSACRRVAALKNISHQNAYLHSSFHVEEWRF